MQKIFVWNSHLQVWHKHSSTPWSRWTRSRWSDALGCFSSSIEKKFPKTAGERIYRRGDWLHCIYLGSVKTRFEIFRNENGELRYFRAIQCHSGGMIISPRLMNHVLIPYRWKRVIYHVGRARDQYFIAEAGLVAGVKRTKRRKANNILHSSWSFQQRCRWSRINYRYQETKESTLSKFIGDLKKIQCTWNHFSTAQRCWTTILSDRFSRQC